MFAIGGSWQSIGKDLSEQTCCLSQSQGSVWLHDSPWSTSSMGRYQRVWGRSSWDAGSTQFFLVRVKQLILKRRPRATFSQASCLFIKHGWSTEPQALFRQCQPRAMDDTSVSRPSWSDGWGWSNPCMRQVTWHKSQGSTRRAVLLWKECLGSRWAWEAAIPLFRGSEPRKQPVIEGLWKTENGDRGQLLESLADGMNGRLSGA